MRTSVTLGIVALFGFSSTACALRSPQLPLDPGANFAAHVDARGIIVDRMDNGQSGRLVAKSTFFHQPSFVVKEGDSDVATLAPDGSDTIVRTAANGGGDTPIGEVQVGREHGAIDLTFVPVDHATYHTTPFRRVERWRTPELLGQPADNVVELPGRYVADVQNAAGATVGWMGVEISRYGPFSRLYDGSLPTSIDGPLAVAAVERLNSEIDWVEQHAIDPNMGN